MMQKRQPLRNKVLNQIQLLKRQLAKQANFNSYNDFLILSLIAPKLSDSILNELIHPLRTIKVQLSQEEEKEVSMKPLLKILAKAEGKDHLLSDFLNASGYDPARPR